MHRLNRIQPALSVQAMQTYAVHAPAATHFRRATCAEVECERWREGWLSLFDEATDLGRRQAAYVRYQSGRHFQEMASEDAALALKRAEIPGKLRAFIFPSGQECFEAHKVRVDRPEIFSVRGGDWRGATSARRIFQRPGDFIESSQETFDRLRTAIERG